MKCNNIYAVTIPNSIRIIESDLFYNCSKLGVIVLPDTIEHIGQHAFTGTAWYNNQPDGVLYLDNWCIRYKNTLPADYVEIAEGTIGIAASAFQGCTELTSVSFPNSLEIIDDYAFYSCRNLVTMSIPNSVIYIGKQAFTMCNSLSGELVIPNSVTYIGGSAFSACNSLTSVVLSNSVSTIENSTFASCSELVSIVIPGSISVIGHGAFGGCSNLSGMLSIPNSVVTIGSNAFYGCSSFTGSLSIPNSVVFIGHNAFDGCTNLLGPLSIPNSVIYIGKEAFADCTEIEQIMVNESNPYYDSRNNCNGIIETNTNTLICGCKNTIIPNSVTAIGNGAFSVCRGLTSINVPESVTYIGVDAFYVCTGLTSIIIPNSVIVIDDFAFQSCSNLISVIIPSSVTTIGKNVFNHCLSLSSVEVYRNEPSTLGINAFDNTHANLKIYVPYESTNLYKSASNWNNYESCIYPMAYTTIPAYSNATNNWRFVASPLVDNIAPTLVDNMITETDYDLYRFDQSEDAEWRNYKANNFDLENGQGYLYANSEDVNIIFKGTFNEDNTKTVDLVYDANAFFAGWNLVGNPFPISAYTNKSYYTMNEDGTAIEPVAVSMGTAIPVCTGVMVKAENTGESVTFSKTAPAGQSANQGVLQIAVAQNNTRSNTVLDKVIVSFNEGDDLGKFVFNRDNAKLYFPKGTEDYAIAYAKKQGEMPLNLVVKENGSYTISVNPKDVEMKYLHLIDNMTGADVDLLATPNYSFEAKTSHYASRFRLVFSAFEDVDIDNGEPFAFINNGNIIVLDADSDATLQIVDVTGHVIVSSDVVRNISTANMTPGVYVLRLVNGDDARIQKIVIH